MSNAIHFGGTSAAHPEGNGPRTLPYINKQSVLFEQFIDARVLNLEALWSAFDQEFRNHYLSKGKS